MNPIQDTPVSPIFQRLTVAVIGLLAIVALLRPRCAAGDSPLRNLGPVEAEVASEFSQIRVRRNGDIRTLIFVRDSGEEALETQMDMGQPHVLRFEYLKHMFASYLIRPEPGDHKNVLIVGLGGGSMVHFLQKHDPAVQIDAVEIDPEVVRIAQRYFGVRPSPKVNLVTADAFQFLRDTPSRYDVIYMDAFLKPSSDTDSTGVPLNLRTQQFYRSLHPKLTPKGMVVFNINPHPGIGEDLTNIRQAFPQTYLFVLPQRGGFVVVASMDELRQTQRELFQNAQKMDRRFDARFSFVDLVRHMDPR